ncbi:fatty acid desaturase [bacterium]|nr:fatty acid desaturase [bacterium]
MRDLPTLTRESRPFTAEDIRKSWTLLFSTFVIWGLMVYGTTIGPVWQRTLFSVLAGMVIVRLFIFYHDYLHGSLFRGSKAVKPILNTLGVLILNPPNVWKRSHNYHHQHNAQMATASIGSYPVMTVKQYEEANWKLRLLYRAARHPLTIFFGYFFIFILGMCTKSFLTDPKRHFDSLVALVVHVALLVGLTHFFGWETTFFSFFLPLFVACGLGAYLFYIQHNAPGIQMRPRTEWTYTFAALQSSTFMDGSWLTHWLTGNIGYHHVHHLNSNIPFYRLPEAMAAIPELQAPIRTSLNPLDVYRCLRLKLWDPERKELVGFREAGFGLIPSYNAR